MPQISHAFPRCNEVTDLSESVHARWTHTGGTGLTAGQCVLLDLTEAIQSQVLLISLIPHHVMCMNIFNRERLTFCSRGKTPTSPGSFLLRIRFSTWRIPCTTEETFPRIPLRILEVPTLVVIFRSERGSSTTKIHTERILFLPLECRLLRGELF